MKIETKTAVYELGFDSNKQKLTLEKTEGKEEDKSQIPVGAKWSGMSFSITNLRRFFLYDRSGLIVFSAVDVII